MPVRFSSPAARAACREAVEALEARSSAEVVIAVRRQSSAWPHAHLVVGIAGMIAASAYMLFSHQPFSTLALLVDPVLAGAALGAASTLSLDVKRWLTPASARRGAVLAAARATFVERGVRRTRHGTGVLVYVSVAERMAAVVADDGVAGAVEPAAWARAVDAIDAAAAGDGHELAAAVRGLAAPLAVALPRHADDANELPDEPTVEARP